LVSGPLFGTEGGGQRWGAGLSPFKKDQKEATEAVEQGLSLDFKMLPTAGGDSLQLLIDEKFTELCIVITY